MEKHKNNNANKKTTKTDVCPECKVRDGDSSKKKLYQCPYCERWFCEKHIEPRIATTRSAIEQIADPILRDKVLEEWRKPDGHPDFVWTKKYFEDLRIKEEMEREKLWKAMDKLKEISESRKVEKLKEIKEIPPSSFTYGKKYTFEAPRRYEMVRELNVNTHKYSIRKIVKYVIIALVIVIVLGLYLAPHTFLSLFGIDIGSYWNLDPVVEATLRSVGVINLTKELNDKVNSIDIRVLEFRIFDRINAEREKYGLPPLKWNEKLAEVARNHSKEMASYNYFGHEGLDCKKVGDRVSRVGIFYTMVGENLLQISLIKNWWYREDGTIVKREYKTPEELVEESIEAWMNSPGHRKNILTKEFDETGVGIAIQNIPKERIEKTVGIKPPVLIIHPIEWTVCPTPSKPDKEATFYITQVFISTKCSDDTIFCNGKCWQKCPFGYTFVCTSSGGLCV